MSQAHVCVVIDHHLKAHNHNTPQHGAEVRDVHEFFGTVCDAVKSATQILVLGSKTAQSDFKHYVEKHRAPVASHIVAYESVDHETEAQTIARAKAFFDKYAHTH